ncbi:MAG: hypothetical protein L0Z62_44805 [Gemmataceae bacterium]|nr:hypothetical protein [Gemmataceae bacterium]
MKASLRALLERVIDYAGLFPPARLPLDESIRNYARYRTEPERWMLGRFICPAARLAELEPFAGLFAADAPLVVSALGRGGNTIEEYLDGVKADLQAIAALAQSHGERYRVDGLEVKLPAEWFRPSCRECARAALLCEPASLLPPGMAVFLEADVQKDWRDQIEKVLRFLSGGFKLRCGGLEAAAFPSVEQVALVLTQCLARGIPLKLTAGLHHPIRRFDASLQVTMHGFLNVFGSGVLAAASNLNEEQVQAILADEEPAHFVFTDSEFRWKEWAAPVSAIERARRERILSFGSCSFDEPRDDLRALGLL